MICFVSSRPWITIDRETALFQWQMVQQDKCIHRYGTMTTTSTCLCLAFTRSLSPNFVPARLFFPSYSRLLLFISLNLLYLFFDRLHLYPLLMQGEVTHEGITRWNVCAVSPALHLPLHKPTHIFPTVHKQDIYIINFQRHSWTNATLQRRRGAKRFPP